MLIGRWFQDYTFDSLAFDRDYKSYFPISVKKYFQGKEKDVLVNEINPDDIIRIRNNEIIPVDAILLKGNANIDYHFVTGESMTVFCDAGNVIYAGEKLVGSIIELRVLKIISESYLTQLWKNKYSENEKNGFEKFVEAISKWFIYVILLIAITAALYW